MFFFCCEIRDVESGSGFNGLTAEEIKKEQKIEEALHASSLRVPRRYFILFFILGMFGFCIIELDEMEFVFLPLYSTIYHNFKQTIRRD
jgi:hypothetical protein